MKLLRKYIRIIAVSLLLVVVQAFVLPIAALALTSGPASPEFATFEPVDATDMVNLQTGDFTYTLPVMNVPGPEGGYPLALSYHAGITMEQDASWVGLGWTLNAGAISRQVRGYADDYNGKMIDVAVYNAGATTTSYYTSIGVAGDLGFGSVGLNVSYKDNFKSIGVSVSGTIGLAPGIGITAMIGTQGVGIAASVGAGLGSVSLSESVGISYNWNGGGATFNQNSSIGLSGIPLASEGVSLSSHGTQHHSSSIGSDHIFSNGSLGQISTSTTTDKTSYDIPLFPLFVSISRNKQTFKWWVAQQLNQNVFGPLYINKGYNQNPVSDQYYNYKMDIYSDTYDASLVADPEHNEANHNSLTFPNYDTYLVNGQGLSGEITPYYTQHGYLVRERKDLQYSKYGFPTEISIPFLKPGDPNNFSSNSNVFFRFANSPESYYRTEVNALSYSLVDPFNPQHFNYNFKTNRIIQNLNGESTYNPINQRIGQSRHIEWYKNSDITAGTAKLNGFLEYDGILPDRYYTMEDLNTLRNDPSEMDPDGIGGFKITAEDGKTYHYSLPFINLKNLELNRNSLTLMVSMLTIMISINMHIHGFLLQ